MFERRVAYALPPTEVDLIRVMGTRVSETQEEEDGMGHRPDSGLWMSLCILFIALLAARRALRL